MKIGIQTWGSAGDIRPFLALAHGLGRAGHDVTLVVTHDGGAPDTFWVDSAQFKLETVGKLDFAPHELDALTERVFVERNPLKQIRLIFDRMLVPVEGEMYAASTRLAAENDLLIGHAVMHTLHAAAESAGKPYVTVTLQHISVPTSYLPPLGLPNLGRALNPVLWRLAVRMAGWSLTPFINRFRTREGLRPLASYREAWESTLMNLVAVSPVICEPKPDWDPWQRACGFFNLPGDGVTWEMPPDLARFLESGAPPVYMTFGSMTAHGTAARLEESIRLMADAAKLAGCRAVIQAPWDRLGGARVDADIYGTSFLRHESVFPRCAAVVHHGGAGTTQSATLCGLPSVVVPHIADQAFWGGELHRLGVAPKPLDRRKVTASALARSIRAALDSPRMHERAKTLGHALKAEDGVGVAVNEIERLADRIH